MSEAAMTGEITQAKKAGKVLMDHEKMLVMLNQAALILLTRGENLFERAMSDGLDIIAGIAEIDRMSVFRNIERPDGLYLSQVYRWRKDTKGMLDVWPELQDVPYAAIAPQLEKLLSAGECVGGFTGMLPGSEIFKRFGCVTLLIIPLFYGDKFWGTALFERLREENFSELETDVLRSASIMLATTVIRNEEAEIIRRANEQSQLMLDAVPLAAVMWDKNQNIINCSQATIHLFGFADKRETVEKFAAAMPEYQPDGTPSRRLMAEQLSAAFEQGYRHFEFTHLTVAGEPVVCDVSLFRMEHKSGHVVLSYARDIREEKQMLTEIARRDELLLSQTHLYQSVLDGVPIPISVTDMDMNLSLINKAAENCFGRKREDMIGKPCHRWDVPICGTKDCSIARLRQGKKQTFFKHNGSSYQVNGEALIDVTGNIAGYIETLQDVTEVENVARQKAEMASRAKSAFLSTMSHEMRTPLNAVIGMTAIGKRSAEIERKNYALDRIEEASTHLLGVINDILDISKIEADKLELSSVEYNFEKMLQKIITVISHRIHEKQQRFSVNVSANVPRFVIGDDQRLAQIIANLLSNAVKFTLEGGEISLNVSLLGMESGICELKFEVADTGIGISAAQQKRLFNAFEQAERETTREFGGTGLGLAISKRLTEMMGGRIWVESEPGQGSHFMFTVKIPVGETNPRSLLNPAIPWEKLRVLAVDGSGSTRQHFKDSFDRLGVDCDTVADGNAARQLIEAHGPFDIYFISWRMTGMDGIELTRWIKARGEKSAVVLISSADWENVQEAARSCGADKGLIKPVFSSALVDCLNELLGNAQEVQNYDSTDEFADKLLLLAEDVAINREIVMSLLEGTGIKIDCAENGEAALAMIEADPNKYDIVFMDVQMPVMDGLSATRRIRALPSPQCWEIPIIAMTANVFKDDIENCFAAGMNDHIGKPISIDDMLGKLRKYLSGRSFVYRDERLEEAGVDIPSKSAETEVVLAAGARISVDIRLIDGQGSKIALSLPSVVEEVYCDGFILIRMPVLGGDYYSLPRDEMLLMYFTAESKKRGAPEVFTIPVRFVERTKRGKYVCAKLEPLGKIEQSNRRRYYRLVYSMNVLLRTLNADEVSFKAGMLDFSEGGMLLAADTNLAINEKVILEFNLGGRDNEIVEGTVLRVDITDDEIYRFRAAVKFDSKNKQQKDRFYRFIVARQMENRRKQ